MGTLVSGVICSKGLCKNNMASSEPKWPCYYFTAPNLTLFETIQRVAVKA